MKIVLVDASQSMAAIDGAATRFDAGRAAAVKELAYKPNTAANLLIASHSHGAVFEAPSANLRLLRERLADAEVSAAALQVNVALEEASRQFALSAAGAVRELVVISDFQRSSWARANFAALPKDTEIRLVSMNHDAGLANVAIEQVRLSATPTAGKPVTVLIDVANHSDDTRGVKCQFDLSAQAEGSGQTMSTALTRAVEGTVPARSKAILQVNVDWPSAGWQWGQVRIVDAHDALPADDVLPVAFGVRPETRIAIVSEADTDKPTAPILFGKH